MGVCVVRGMSITIFYSFEFFSDFFSVLRVSAQNFFLPPVKFSDGRLSHSIVIYSFYFLVSRVDLVLSTILSFF